MQERKREVIFWASLQQRIAQMKMNPATFHFLKMKIDGLISDRPSLINQYENGHFFKSEKVTNLQQRFNWDIFHLAQTNDIDFTDLNDSHIDTALRMICPKIEKKF